MEFDIPTTLFIDALSGTSLDIIADDLHVLNLLLADEMGLGKVRFTLGVYLGLSS